MVGKRLLEFGKLTGAIGPDWLLDHVMKKLLDERFVRLIGVGQELCEFAGTLIRPDLAGWWFVGAADVDRLSLFFGSEPTDGVEIFETEAERVDHPVAGDASLRAGLKRHALASGQTRVKIGGERRNRLGRWSKRPAEHTPGDEDASVYRRAGRGVREVCQEVRMRQDAGSLVGIEPNFPERGVGRQVDPIKRREPAVDVDLIGQ